MYSQNWEALQKSVEKMIQDGTGPADVEVKEEVESSEDKMKGNDTDVAEVSLVCSCVRASLSCM